MQDMQKKYQDALEVINLLSNMQDELSKEQKKQLDEAWEIVAFFETIYLHSSAGEIVSKIGEAFQQNIQQAIIGNEQEINNLQTQFDNVKAKYEDYCARLENVSQSSEKNRKLRKMKEIASKNLKFKIDGTKIQLASLHTEGNLAIQRKQNNEQMLEKFNSNPLAYVSDFITKTQYKTEAYLSIKLIERLLAIRENVGGCALTPGKNSLVNGFNGGAFCDANYPPLTRNKFTINVLLTRLVLDYFQDGNSQLMKAVEENRKFRIKESQNDRSIYCLLDLIGYFQNGGYKKDEETIENANKTLQSLEDQERKLFSNKEKIQAQKNTIKESIKETNNKFFEQYYQWGFSNLCKNSEFLDIIGLDSDCIKYERRSSDSQSSGSNKPEYWWYFQGDKNQEVRDHIITEYKSDPQQFISKLKELIKTYEREKSYLEYDLKQNIKKTPESGKIEYGDLSRLLYYKHVAISSEYEAEQKQCIAILSQTLEFLNFYKKGGKVNLTNEHADSLATEVLNDMNVQISCSKGFTNITSQIEAGPVLN
ncbi:MAG: hypothetical protein IJR82_04640 [Bacilli bacterium]|nr:hypothetical protein [Bacilli bacterium]